jgi:hypothetical protein
METQPHDPVSYRWDFNDGRGVGKMTLKWGAFEDNGGAIDMLELGEAIHVALANGQTVIVRLKAEGRS